MPSPLRHALLALALLLWSAAGVQAAEAAALQVVQVEGLGPMLFVGQDGSSAVRMYVDDLIEREVFPTHTASLRSFAAQQTRATSLGELRQKGRPLIGIQVSSETDLVGTREQKRNRRGLLRAVERAGGTAVFLPPAGAEAHLASLLGALDHLILAGGDDVHPSLYHEAISGSVGVNLKRDIYELALIRQATAKKIGITAICRGYQLLNVALGGRLAQEILGGVAAARRHAAPGFKPVYHEIKLAKQSRTAAETGKLLIPTVSLHHQAVTIPGRGLRVVGRSHDGLIEAVEGAEGRIRGYQFHPERSRSPAVRGIFKSMVNRAKASMAPSGRSSRR